jgi:hypothetical protein
LPLASGPGLLLGFESDLLLGSESDLLPKSGPDSGANLLIASGRETPIGFMCAISGAILGRKRPKYNKTLRATATTPTTSTTIGLLSVCSNLLTPTVVAPPL